jgi:hypothetical protein
MSNHSGEDDPAIRERILREMGGEFADIKEKLGPTGRFPQGKLTSKDEGEIKIAIGRAAGKVVIDFGKPTAWIGFPPDDAIEIAKAIVKHAEEIKAGR